MRSYLDVIWQRIHPVFGPVINLDRDTGKQEIMDGQHRLYTIYFYMKDKYSNKNGVKF